MPRKNGQLACVANSLVNYVNLRVMLTVLVTSDVESLELVEWLPAAFDELVLEIRNKTSMIALVTEQQSSEVTTEGLVILLYGEPEVGKTASVKAAAESIKFPLIALGPADLGSTAGGAEHKLAQLFRFGQRWKAILLLDDADVFLERRSRSNAERNAQVSVFLRAFEIYRGTLFVTTNQFEALDEAFKSRVRLALRYSAFTEHTGRKIWTNILSTLEHSGGDVYELKNHLAELANLKLNGREISNIYLNAKQFASSKYEPLRREHIKMAVEMLKGERVFARLEIRS